MTLKPVKPYLYFFLLISIPCTACAGLIISAKKQFAESTWPLAKKESPKKHKKKSRQLYAIAQEGGEDSLQTLINLLLVCVLMLVGLILRRLWTIQDSSIPLPHPYDSDQKEYTRKVKSKAADSKSASE